MNSAVLIEPEHAPEASLVKKTLPLEIAIVGAGNRSMLYASYALRHPSRMRVVAVAEPDPARRAEAARIHGIPSERQFAGYEDLVREPRLADAAINGTMDQLHYASSLALMRAGYHLLLEKPIASTEEEVRHLIDCATVECRRTVMVCHVLRYAPFYQAIKGLLDDGEIGRILALHTSENVSYHHMATAFVRGRWNREDRSNPMLLAKCCHDLDIIAWLMSGEAVTKVSSFGSLAQFRQENAPAGSAARCLQGCPVEADCDYSARRMYIDRDIWGGYAWESLRSRTLTVADKLESLQTDNPYGRCVWRCDNDVVDHQTVILEFANGATASHNMLCATARATRTIHIVGTKGEIEGDLESAWIKLRKIDLNAEHQCREETIEVRNDAGGPAGHGGGDERLVADFVHVLAGEASSRGVTRIEDSLTGHLIAFMAEKSRKAGTVITVP